MTWWVKLIVLLLSGMVSFLMASPPTQYDVNPDLFPVAENLANNVNFWISVFGHYSEHEAILHDTRDLNIIYEVADFSNTSEDTLKSRRLKQRKVNKIKNKYRDILRKLAHLKKEELPNLTAEERRVYDLFKGQQNGSRFRLASYNIRAQFGLREEFMKGLVRSGMFIDEMQRIFREHGLPEELTCLPHVESSFNYKAYSKVGAAGMWQFTRKTGARFLKINYMIDDRIDPLRATEAAAKFLKNNYETLEAWPLAITAYNHGVNGMKRAKRVVGSSNFGIILQKYRSRTFKFASRNFYAEFIAAVHVRKNYRQYFGNIPIKPVWEFVYFELPQRVSIQKLMELFTVDVNTIKEYNPSIRRSAYSAGRRLPKGFTLRLPKKDGIDISEVYAYFIQPNPKSESGISRRNQNTIADLKPTKFPSDQNHKTNSSSELSNEKKNLQYLPQLVSAEILSANTITLRPDESVEQLADWLEITPRRLYQLNNLQEDDEINIGQKIKLNFSNVSPAVFHLRRQEYHQSIEDDYFEYYAVTGVRIYKIQPDEDVWALCDGVYEIPYWLLLKYNANLDFNQLKAGDEVIFPVVIAISDQDSEIRAPGSDG
jgi:membrane-bound lytic murein transglycosylase D